MKHIILRTLLPSLLLLSQLVSAQKNYTISSKNVTAWAPMADGMAQCYSTITNTSSFPGDTIFWWEYLDSNQPSTWTLGFCALPSCYTIPAVTKESFIVKTSGGTLDFDCSHNFGNYPNYVAGTGTARFLVYREGLKGNADTITFIGTAAGSGVAAKAKGMDITVSPNPVKNTLILTLSDPAVTSISIVDLVGKEIMKLDYTQAHSFDVSRLPNGIYFLQVSKGTEVYNKKFVISH
jgi:hypothetical protein